MSTDDEIAAVLRDLAHAHGPDKSFCPSEAARRLSAEWRPLMPEVRRIAAQIGLKATQDGVTVDPMTARGPIRFRLDPHPRGGRAQDSAGSFALEVASPLGPLTLAERDGALVSVSWRGCAGSEPTPVLREAATQFAAYFSGRLEDFDLPWRVITSPAQARACKAMAAIPFGETRAYGQLAQDLGIPAQAMGQLCGANPLPILVPCHRVLGATGLGGFSGGRGIEDKVWLLRHEGAAGLLL